MESKATAKSTPHLLPLHNKSSTRSLPDEATGDSSGLEAVSVRTERSREDVDGSDPDSLSSDSQSEEVPTITLLPSAPSTPITSLLSLSETPYTLLAAHHETTGRVYKIQNMPGKGVGALATTFIPAGTRIIAETPIMAIHRRDWKYETTQRMAVIQAYLSLPHPHTQLYDSLVNSPPQYRHWHDLIEQEWQDAQPFGPEDEPHAVPFDSELSRSEQTRIMAVFATNTFGVHHSRDKIEAVICPEASRLNHACAPNVQFVWNDILMDGALTMHAVRDIDAGEELTVGYIELLECAAERHEKLRAVYGFDCSCVVCGADDATVRLSDCRREMMRNGLATCKKARAEAPKWCSLSPEVREILESVVALHQEEGLLGLSAADAFRMEIDRHYMQQTLVVLERCIGADHMLSMRTKRKIDDIDVKEEMEADARAHSEMKAAYESATAHAIVESSSAAVREQSSAATVTAATSPNSDVPNNDSVHDVSLSSSPNDKLEILSDGVALVDIEDCTIEFDGPNYADDLVSIPCFDGGCDTPNTVPASRFCFDGDGSKVKDEEQEEDEEEEEQQGGRRKRQRRGKKNRAVSRARTAVMSGRDRR
ncbi:uncharacterized protein IWZ02DRAFT_64729 [Phyllosticta citriasiana]|uniref:uncharacterized protein n=1 Tax=Phyllosticta citriasiana TaxID=595635 RepID=UPI0030FD64A2